MVELTSQLSGFFWERLETAMGRRSVTAAAPTQLYLLQMLVEFASGPPPEGDATLVERMAGAATTSEPSERLRRFREIGDHTLYSCGFFSDHLERKGISKSYVVAMGGRAYGQAGELARRPSVGVERGFADVYPELADKFEVFVDVLDDVRENTAMRTPQDIVKLYERWAKTGSLVLAERLEEEGVFPQRASKRVIH